VFAEPHNFGATPDAGRKNDAAPASLLWRTYIEQNSKELPVYILMRLRLQQRKYNAASAA
jgi:hypothetical protein